MCVSFQTMVSSLCRWKRLPVTAVVANQNGSLNTASSSIISIFCHETHCCFHLLCQVSTWVVVMVAVMVLWKTMFFLPSLKSMFSCRILAGKYYFNRTQQGWWYWCKTNINSWYCETKPVSRPTLSLLINLNINLIKSDITMGHVLSIVFIFV